MLHDDCAKCQKNYAPLAFSDDEVQSAINKAINYRTKVLNFLLTTFHIPDVCKIARVFPLMIPGKPANLGESHTPFYIQYIFRIFCCCFFIIDFLSFEKIFFLYIFIAFHIHSTCFYFYLHIVASVELYASTTSQKLLLENEEKNQNNSNSAFSP